MDIDKTLTFVAPMYNQLIESNLTVKYVLLDNNETIFSGTPDEYLKQQ